MHLNFELLIKAAATNISAINAAAIKDDDDEREEELDYRDDCITQQEWDALFNEDNDDEDLH